MIYKFYIYFILLALSFSSANCQWNDEIKELDGLMKSIDSINVKIRIVYNRIDKEKADLKDSLIKTYLMMETTEASIHNLEIIKANITISQIPKSLETKMQSAILTEVIAKNVSDTFKRISNDLVALFHDLNYSNEDKTLLAMIALLDRLHSFTSKIEYKAKTIFETYDSSIH